MTAGTSMVHPGEAHPEERPAGGEPPVTARAEPPLAPLPRGVLAIISVALMALCFAQAPGRLLADTKLNLVIDPAGFMGAALHLWDPSSSFGQIQNQAVGYLFPMGPFFALGNSLGVSMWVVQRIWLGLVLIAAFWGVAVLARQLGIGRPVQWVVAGAAYALSPFFLGQLTSTSAALLPAALLPWALLPLVHGSRGGSPRRAAALSGIAIAAMGGVNAAATLAVLPLPALWLITRRRSPRRRALAGWWVVALALATAWWALPLLLQHHSGFNFLHYSETSATTEATTSAFAAVRGSGQWLAYLNLDGPWLPGGWELVSTVSIVLATALIAATGFAGLARARVPERGFLVSSVLLGAALVCAGYLGPAGGVLDGPIRSALDGPLGAFRNVAKFEPVLLLPLALGLAAALAAVPRRRLWTVLAATGTAAVVLVAALPLVQGDLPQRGSFERIPSQWRQLSDFLGRHSHRANSLLVPGSPFGEYNWGRPLDEPMQALASSPWSARNLIPLGGVGSTALMDAFENQLQNPVSAPGLERALARAGIRYVVARNDLDWRRANAPRPVEVREALVAAGLHRVTSFGKPLGRHARGPLGPGSQISELGIGRVESRIRAIDVYRVHPRESLVTALPAARSIAVSGGPQSLVELANQGVVRRRDPTLTVADGGEAGPRRRWAVTDSLRRTDTDLGLVHYNTSYSLAPGESAAGAPGPPRQLLGAEATVGHEAVSHLGGEIARVAASSYGSWLLQLPFAEPANAFDHNSATAWVTGSPSSSEGEWVQANLKRTIEPSRVRLRLLEDGPWRPTVSRVRVSTASGSVVSAVDSNESMQRVAAPSGPTSWVRITFARVSGERDGGATAGLRDVRLLTDSAGARSQTRVPPTTQWLRVPEEASRLTDAARPGAPLPAFAFSRLRANPRDPLTRDQEDQLRRIFVAPRAARMLIRATAVPHPGSRLDRLLTRTNGMNVRTSSSWLSLPQYRAGNVIDASRRTSWVAAPSRPLPTGVPGAPGLRGFGTATSPRFSSISPAPTEVDPDPAIKLHWKGERTLSRLRIERAGDFAAPPKSIHVASPDGARDLTVPADGVMNFKPLRTNRVTVTFPRVARRFTTTGAPGDRRTRLPVGLAELNFPALKDMRVLTLGPDSVIREPCGGGPSILLDGRRIPTRVKTTAGEVVQLNSLAVRVCRRKLSLAAGKHRLAGAPGSPFTLSSATLRPPNWASSAPRTSSRRTRIRRWNDDRRTVAVGSGPAAYLAVRENYNAGWDATLDGTSLSAVQLDGWQQGFLLPKGSGGVVHLEFAPERSYDAALWIGAGLALALIALALIPARRGGPEEDRGEAEEDYGGGRRRPGVIGLGALATVVVALVSLPVAFAVPLIVMAALRWPAATPWAAGAVILLAAVAAAVDLDPVPLDHAGAFGVPAQLLTALALAILAASLLSSMKGETVER